MSFKAQKENQQVKVIEVKVDKSCTNNYKFYIFFEVEKLFMIKLLKYIKIRKFYIFDSDK